MEFSIIIPTYNRADELRETIRSLAKLTWSATGNCWSSTTNHPITRARRRRRERNLPATLRYLYEPEQGRYAALNTGIRAGHRKDHRDHRRRRTG
jgi:hypothetical protein